MNDDGNEDKCNDKKSTDYAYKWWIQDFRDGGRQPLSLGQKPITGQDFCRKLHENERNWTKRGVCILV